jgi:hypothetical protein
MQYLQFFKNIFLPWDFLKAKHPIPEENNK